MPLGVRTFACTPTYIRIVTGSSTSERQTIKRCANGSTAITRLTYSTTYVEGMTSIAFVFFRGIWFWKRGGGAPVNFSRLSRVCS